MHVPEPLQEVALESDEFVDEVKGCNSDDSHDWRRKRHDVDKVTHPYRQAHAQVWVCN